MIGRAFYLLKISGLVAAIRVRGMFQRHVVFAARSAGTAASPLQAHVIADFLERLHRDLMLLSGEGSEHAVVTDPID